MVPAGAPATTAVVALEAVMVGATSLASPIPRPLASVFEAPLSPGDEFATVTLHSVVVAVSSSVSRAVTDVELTKVVESTVMPSVPQPALSETTAPGWKPEPATVTV